MALGVHGTHPRDYGGPPKWLLRAGAWPTILVRMGAGRLIGNGMAIVTHRGRRTGRLYQTAVQVLDRNPATGEIFVVAWSRRADWFRNIQRASAVEVWDLGRRFKPVQTFLSEDEIAASLLAHGRKHRFQASMRRMFIAAPRTENEARDCAKTAGGVAFRPTS